MAEQTQLEERRFNKILGFIFYVVTVVMAYVFCITFLKVPESSKDLANISLGFLLGNVLGVCVGYLVVGTPDKKKDIQPGTTQSSVTVTKVEPTEENKP
jgi:hypothetical protein